MIDRRNQKQMTVMMSTELGEMVEQIIERNDQLSEHAFVREAIRREAQRYEQEGHNDE